MNALKNKPGARCSDQIQMLPVQQEPTRFHICKATALLHSTGITMASIDVYKSSQ